MWSEPATTDGRVAAPPYVPVQAAEVGSVIHAARGVQVVLSHFPKYHLSNLKSFSLSKVEFYLQQLMEEL